MRNLSLASASIDLGDGSDVLFDVTVLQRRGGLLGAMRGGNVVAQGRAVAIDTLERNKAFRVTMADDSVWIIERTGACRFCGDDTTKQAIISRLNRYRG